MHGRRLKPCIILAFLAAALQVQLLGKMEGVVPICLSLFGEWLYWADRLHCLVCRHITLFTGLASSITSLPACILASSSVEMLPR